VCRRPLLIIPPWINKFYILDLREKNSFIKWAVDQGHTVFVVSWVNPDAKLAEKGFDDYLTEGALAAMDATLIGMEGAARRVQRWAEAAEAGVDVDQAEIERIQQLDDDGASEFGVSVTPTFVINGVRYEGEQPVERFVEIIDPLLSSDG